MAPNRPCSRWRRPRAANVATGPSPQTICQRVPWVKTCAARSARALLILGLGTGAIGPGVLTAHAADCPPRRTELPTLSQGDSGQDVRRLQGLLTLLGFYQGNTDGQYNAALTSAVRSFQQALNLDPSGSVNAETWAQLLPNPLCSPRSTAGNSDP